MNIETVTDQNWQQTVDSSDLPLLVDLWAPWCGPCLKMTPILEQVAERRHGRTRILKLNVDENPQTARQYGVMSIPTLLVIRDGEEKGRLVGLRSAEEIEQELDRLQA